MSDQSGAGHLDRQEIIIVRRRRADEEEGHHGGVWKIAFADFMTAMMAFFLVMWLTNASDDATKKQIAQYFNPIKMNDSSPSTRGVETSDDGAVPDIRQRGASDISQSGDLGGKPLAGSESGGEEQAIFRDPYAVLAEIAAQAVATGGGDEEGVPDGSGLPGLNGGDAYRDPFDPASWQLDPNIAESGGKLEDASPAEFETTVEIAAVAEPAAPAGGEVEDAAEEGAPEPAEPSQTQAEGEAADGNGQTGDAAGEEAEGSEAASLRGEIEAELESVRQALPSSVEVSQSEAGITISLADAATGGMFEIGSAKPTAAAIAMMEKIAAVLSARDGTVVIRGHTDARPFQGIDYDNWRLSTARAHMAYYMLARGGFDESRVTAIEGLADRQPKDAADPEGAVNRRIEILLKAPAA